MRVCTTEAPSSQPLTPTLSRLRARELYPQVHEHLKPSVDVERITARIALRSARPRDLSGLRDTLKTLPQLYGSLAKCDAPLLSSWPMHFTCPHPMRPTSPFVQPDGTTSHSTRPSKNDGQVAGYVEGSAQSAGER